MGSQEKNPPWLRTYIAKLSESVKEKRRSVLVKGVRREQRRRSGRERIAVCQLNSQLFYCAVLYYHFLALKRKRDAAYDYLKYWIAP